MTNEPVIDLALNTINKKKQALLFVNTKRSAESVAEKISKKVQGSQKTKDLADKILKVLTKPTKQCKRLANCIERGIAFHHSGLHHKQRELIEESFKKGIIKIICATTTLAAGLDLPAFRAIIRDLKRFGPRGLQPIPVLEYLQMAGRCVSGDTFIYTDKGFMKINELFEVFSNSKKEIHIYCLNTSSFKITKSKITGVYQRRTNSFLEIKTRSGKTIKVTKEHPFFTFKKLYCGKPMLSKQSFDYSGLYEKAIFLRKEGYSSGEIIKKLSLQNRKRMVEHWIYEKTKPTPYGFVWKEAQQLKKGETYSNTDYLSLCLDYNSAIKSSPRNFLPWDKIKQLDKNIFMMKQGKKKVKFPKKWSKNLVRFIAKIMADGSLLFNKKDNSYLIRYFNKNESVQKEYQQITKSLFDKNISYIWRRGAYQSSFKSFVVGQFLNNIGIPHGKKSFKLIFPHPFFSLSKELILVFFREYCFCDGWEEPKRCVILSSSEMFINEFGLVLSSFGFVPRIYKKKPNTFRTKPIFELSITKTQLDRIPNFKTVNHIFPDQIKSIKEIKEECFVYDISVEEHHNFIANGLIIHNSGRPDFDKFGEAIVIANSDGEKQALIEQYLKGEPEDIYSKLAVEPVLRVYVLSLIVSKVIRTPEDIFDFFSKTFWAFQYKDMNKLKRIISRVVKMLERWGFIQFVEEEYFRATIIGKRISELYLDPATAIHLIKGIEVATSNAKDFAWLHLLSDTLEMRPLLRVKNKEFEEFEQLTLKYESELLLPEPSMFEPEYNDWLNAFKTAMMFHDWTDEKDEEWILEKYDCRPGETRAKLNICDWLVYACEELARLLGKMNLITPLKRLRIRLKHGIKEELLPLIKFEGIGRMRARKLFRAGIKDAGDVKKAKFETLSQILTSKLATNLKKQVGSPGRPESLEKF